MANKTVTVRNTETGGVAVIPTKWLNNPKIINPNVFVVVDDGAKPYVKDTYKPRSADEFGDDQKRKRGRPRNNQEPFESMDEPVTDEEEEE